MGRMAWEREMEAARMVALRAGEVALRYLEEGVAAEWKPDSSPVTEADRQCERLIARALAEAFPEDGLLGEEGAEKDCRSGRRWIIDPIDGTRDFIRGNDNWGVLIALEADGDIVAGACNLPARDEVYCAARGVGAWRNGDRIGISSIDVPEQSMICVNELHNMTAYPWAGRLLEFLDRFAAVRCMGGCQDAMMVSSGLAEAWFEPSAEPWDLAPLKVIAEEAGARFFNITGGGSVHGGSCILCVPPLEETLRQFVGAPAS